MKNKAEKIYEAITAIDEDIVAGTFDYQPDTANNRKRVQIH